MKRHISLLLVIIMLFVLCFTLTDSYAYLTDREIVHSSASTDRVNFYSTMDVENELVGDKETIPKLTFSYKNLGNTDIFSFLKISFKWKGDTPLDNIVLYDGNLDDSVIINDTSYSKALSTSFSDDSIVLISSSVVHKQGTETFKIVFKEIKNDILEISAVNDYKQNIYSEVGFNGVYLFDSTINVLNSDIFTYTINNNYVTITGLTDYGKTISDIIIPSDIDGLPVIAIFDNAFDGSSFNTVLISETVNSIGSNAFGNCSNLTSINVSEVNSNFISSDGVLFNKNMTELVAYPAGKNTSIYSVPDTVIIINNAFNGASNLNDVNIPETVNEIHSTAFNNCKNLTAIHVDNYEGSIANPPWGSNATVYWLTRPEDLDPEDIFIFTVDNGKTTITGLTENGRRIKNLEIPETLGNGTVITIAESALSKTTATEVTIPSTVTTIGDQSEFGKSFQSVRTLNYNANASKLEYYRSAFADTNITTLNIGSSVTVLNDSMFDGMNNLVTVNYDGNVMTAGRIQYPIFNRCSKLTYFNIGENVTQIPANILYGVNSLQTITIPDNVTTIGANAFNGTGITEITVPSTIIKVGNYAFANCDSLVNIVLNNNAISNYMFYDCNALKTVVIPSNINTVGSNAFQNCTSLTDVTFENKTIGANMFYGCTGLQSITIPPTITKVGAGAFQNCTGLKEFTLENGLMSDSMFGGCTSLETVIITDNISALSQRVFQGCSGLKEVVFMGATMPTITITSFLDCTGVTDIYINDEVTSITSTYFSNFSANTNLTIHYNGTATGFPWGATNAVLDSANTSNDELLKPSAEDTLLDNQNEFDNNEIVKKEEDENLDNIKESEPVDNLENNENNVSNNEAVNNEDVIISSDDNVQDNEIIDSSETTKNVSTDTDNSDTEIPEISITEEPTDSISKNTEEIEISNTPETDILKDDDVSDNDDYSEDDSSDIVSSMVDNIQ